MSNQSSTGAASGCFPMRVFIGALASVVLLQVAHPWTCVADHPANRRGRMAKRSSSHAAGGRIAPPSDAAVVEPEYQRPAGPRPPNSVMQFGTPVPWEVLAQGEYIGPSRLPHVPEYRLRVDDVVEFIFRLTGKVTGAAYRLNVGDVLDFESLTATELTREVIIQPDGTITLRYLGQVRAEGRTVDALRQELEERYKRLINDPNILVTPVKTNTTLEELRATVDSRAGAGGQSRQARVTPEGTVQLPAIGSVPAQGLTLDEMKREIDRRYAQLVHGISVTPILIQRAPRFVYVVGEVRNPGRFTLEAPTSTTQAIALAGGWNIGGNLRQIVVFRRTEDWRWRATKLDMRPQLLGKAVPCFNEIWLRDSDIVVVPKHPILVLDDLIELVFTRGIYGVLPFNAAYQMNNLTVL